MMVVLFPVKRAVVRPPVAPRRLKAWLGLLLNKLHVPGIVRPMEFDDPDTGHQLRIRLDPLHLRLTLDDQEYCFDRFNGKLSGLGPPGV